MFKGNGILANSQTWHLNCGHEPKWHFGDILRNILKCSRTANSQRLTTRTVLDWLKSKVYRYKVKDLCNKDIAILVRFWFIAGHARLRGAKQCDEAKTSIIKKKVFGLSGWWWWLGAWFCELMMCLPGTCLLHVVIVVARTPPTAYYLCRLEECSLIWFTRACSWHLTQHS